MTNPFNSFQCLLTYHLFLDHLRKKFVAITSLGQGIDFESAC